MNPHFPYDEIFHSVVMSDYFKQNPLKPEKLVEAIQGAPIPLARKLQLLTDLDEKEYPCAEPIRHLTKAMKELVVKPGEFFLLRYCWFVELICSDTEITAPYLSIEQAINAIRKIIAESEIKEDTLCWFQIEKWVPDGAGALINLYGSGQKAEIKVK